MAQIADACRLLGEVGDHLGLTEQGRLDLDADIAKYLTSVSIPPTFPKPVTSRRLMTHHGGFETAIFHLGVPPDARVEMTRDEMQREVVRVRPVDAPPSANAVAGTVDLYFALDNRDRAYRVGQRVSVALPLAGGRSEGLSVPTSAILRDIYGGEWVYAKTEADTYVRQRIEVAATEGGRAILSRGLRPGTLVVTAGAAELFGTEFGVAH